MLSELQGELAKEQQALDMTRDQLAAMQELRDWFESNPKPVLERNDCSRLHRLRDKDTEVFVVTHTTDRMAADSCAGLLDAIQQTFVVKHDWAGAFEGAEGLTDDLQLPYDICAFEFRISGRSVILTVMQHEAELVATPFIESRGYWYSLPADEAKVFGVTKFAWDQVRAICIALDSGVATDSVIRAPHKLNEKRIRAGKVPLADYRVVDLSRRHRVANPVAGQCGGKKRLHFRRGHWRHYETSKTWIRWCLVGDPDLGFISKHYQL